MKTQETIDKLIALVYEQIEKEEFGIEHYPGIVKKINTLCKEEEKLEEKKLAEVIENKIKECETKIMEWKDILNNINLIKSEMKLE